MASRAGLFLLMLYLAMAAVSSFSFGESNFQTVTSFDIGTHNMGSCNGQVGDCIDEDEEGMMVSEAARRTLAQKQKYITYGALKANRVPCNRNGRPYYNCNQRGKANPYSRGCSRITRDGSCDDGGEGSGVVSEIVLR
ncbi:hypothetical protein TEA_012374 [Camellia sinensis var. sinensis]|uniref:Rapid alkalinization factor 1 n=1 Tax=Camellia sinensis var. sinensis TaxID=542762 RepID=A0A4S4DES3_CAMSN|nr:hypothetical protein TEA_012374 [Camellia sinensis var. sinensis]